MVRTQKLRKIGGSVATVLPKAMLERLNLDAGDTVNIVETRDGLLITPFDKDFAEAMEAYRTVATQYRNALRELAR